MSDIVGWATIGIVFATIPILLVIGLRHSLSRRPVEEKYRDAMSGGLAGAFDAVWSPTAHDANQDRDRQQRASIPAPTPDRDPGRMGDDGRITIEID
ncbi:hypothetical protein [Microbacterium abyssi]|uniref:hypothetical protein n=1 Tax=Microbacterium abyssi TaxID=2782166 RepID=UPI001888C337|nr:hypothetical protein [Microbacterium sp. A18JL241]